MYSKWNRAGDILLIEDNEGDIVLTRLAFERAALPHRLHVAISGEEALSLLDVRDVSEHRLRPDLILLDMHLPRKQGLEVLTELKRHPQLCRIPVMVLSSSQDMSDIQQAYQQHANGYFIKPSDIEGLIELLTAIDNFWFRNAALPSLKAVS